MKCTNVGHKSLCPLLIFDFVEEPEYCAAINDETKQSRKSANICVKHYILINIIANNYNKILLKLSIWYKSFTVNYERIASLECVLCKIPFAKQHFNKKAINHDFLSKEKDSRKRQNCKKT